MRIIEKKCPNCGAGLEFDNNAKSCKCEYCKKSYAIEMESKDRDFYSPDNFNLMEKKSSTIFLIVFAVIFTIVFAGIFMIGSNMMHSNYNDDEWEDVFTKVSDFSNSNLESFDTESYWIIYNNDKGLVDYHLDMKIKREKMYVAYNKKKDSNIVVVVYKTKYAKLLDKENIYNLYVPIIFENLAMVDSPIELQLKNGYVKAPEYYFNLEHSEYSYGYQDMETLEKEVIEPLKKEYKIDSK